MQGGEEGRRSLMEVYPSFMGYTLRLPSKDKGGIGFKVFKDHHINKLVVFFFLFNPLFSKMIPGVYEA